MNSPGPSLLPPTHCLSGSSHSMTVRPSHPPAQSVRPHVYTNGKQVRALRAPSTQHQHHRPAVAGPYGVDVSERAETARAERSDCSSHYAFDVGLGMETGLVPIVYQLVIVRLISHAYVSRCETPDNEIACGSTSERPRPRQRRSDWATGEGAASLALTAVCWVRVSDARAYRIMGEEKTATPWGAAPHPGSRPGMGASQNRMRANGRGAAWRRGGAGVGGGGDLLSHVTAGDLSPRNCGRDV